MNLRGLASLSAVCATLVTTHADAGNFDLTGFVDHDSTGYTLDEPTLDLALEDVIASLRPALASTSRTSGSAGFALTLGYGWTPISADSDAWTRGLDGHAPAALGTLQLEARKGLPMGLELSAAVTHSQTLGMTAASFALRWAWLEGLSGIPDMGLRIDGGAIVGDSELTIATAGLELVMGYPVSVLGLFNLAPYAGYSLRFGHTIERRVALLDDVSAMPFITVLPSQNVVLSHAIVGLRVQTAQLDVGLEATLGTSVGLVFQVGARL